MEERANPARHLERLVEEVLGQRIFAVDFAWGYTLLERHLEALRRDLEGLPSDDPLRRPALEALEAMDQAMGHVRSFTEGGGLGELDRGVAQARRAAWAFEEVLAAARREAREDLARRICVQTAVQREWQRDWAATVTRHRGESRITFSCRACGWEFSYVEEAPVGELEVPFGELSCPLCEPDEPA